MTNDEKQKRIDAAVGVITAGCEVAENNMITVRNLVQIAVAFADGGEIDKKELHHYIENRVRSGKIQQSVAETWDFRAERESYLMDNDTFRKCSEPWTAAELAQMLGISKSALDSYRRRANFSRIPNAVAVKMMALCELAGKGNLHPSAVELMDLAEKYANGEKPTYLPPPIEIPQLMKYDFFMEKFAFWSISYIARKTGLSDFGLRSLRKGEIKEVPNKYAKKLYEFLETETPPMSHSEFRQLTAGLTCAEGGALLGVSAGLFSHYGNPKKEGKIKIPPRVAKLIREKFGKRDDSQDNVVTDANVVTEGSDDLFAGVGE